MKRALFLIILIITLTSAARAIENVDIDIPENMYRSAVAIGYIEHVLDPRTGEVKPRKQLLGTGVLIIVKAGAAAEQQLALPPHAHRR